MRSTKRMTRTEILRELSQTTDTTRKKALYKELELRDTYGTK